MLFEKFDQGRSAMPRSEPCPRVVDGLIVGDDEVWLIVARHAEDLDEWLLPGTGAGMADLRICRAVRDDDTLVLGETDPERDVLLSELGGSA